MKILLLQSAAAGLLATFIFAVVFFVIAVLLTRWIFGIPTIIENLKGQSQNLRLMTRLTERIAEQQGIPKEEIEMIKRKAYNLPTPIHEEKNKSVEIK